MIKLCINWYFLNLKTAILISVPVFYHVLFFFTHFRILGFNRIPPVVGRLINVTTEIREITTDHRLSRTFFTSPGVWFCFKVLKMYSLWTTFYHIQPTKCLCLLPSSGERLFLRPVWVLLFNRASPVWTTTWARGFPGCHAAWPGTCSA